LILFKRFLASLRRLFFSCFDRFLNSSSADFTVSGDGSAFVVLAVGSLAVAATGSVAGRVAAVKEEAETETINDKNRNRVAIFFILDILVNKYSEESFRINASDGITKQIKCSHGTYSVPKRPDGLFPITFSKTILLNK
jgi:hypothetical protein